MTDAVDLGIPGLADYRRIGSGGFATVYEAFEHETDRTVAVKILAAMDERGLRRFDRERRTMGQTTAHDNIVTLFRSGYTEPDRRPYLVMEHMTGGSLQDRLDNEGPLAIEDAIEVVLPVVAALGFAHTTGIIHKDVKPANILISATGVPKLSDFGIAAIRDATNTSQMAFSLLYTPPETFKAARGPDGETLDPRDERSDLYSLAATLFTLTTGAPLFSAENQATLMGQILSEAPPATGHAGLDEFFAVALAKAPASRFPTATQFAEGLQAVLRAPHPPAFNQVRSSPRPSELDTVPAERAVDRSEPELDPGPLPPDTKTDDERARGSFQPPAKAPLPPGGREPLGEQQRSRRRPMIATAVVAAAVLLVLAVIQLVGGDPGTEPSAGADSSTGPDADPETGAGEPEGDGSDASEAGSTGTALADSSGQPLRIGVVAPSAADDLGWTQSMVDAIETIGASRPIELSTSDGTFLVDDAASLMQSYAEDGFDLVIAHGSQYGGPVEEIAGEFPDTSFAWGTGTDTFGLDNVFSYTVKADQGGYVQGVIATAITGSNAIGVVGPVEVGEAKLYVDGFVAGAEAQNPSVDVRVTYIDSFSDVALAAEAAQAHVTAGVDVMTGSGPMVVGATTVANEADTAWLGTQANQAALGERIVVSSQVYHWEVMLADMIDAIEAGLGGGETFVLDLDNGGLVIEFNDRYGLPDEVRAVADETIARIVDGSIDTGAAG